MAMYGFITADGTYYEADRKILPTHTQVVLRSPEPSPQLPLDLPPHQPMPMPVVREIPQTPPAGPREDPTYRMDENTQFKFKLKDIIVVVAFIVSIAISWNNSDTKMTRNADQISSLKTEIATLRGDYNESMKAREEQWRRQEDTNRGLVSQITDVERAMYSNMRSGKK